MLDESKTNDNKIILHVFRQAEIGEWKNLEIDNIEKIFKINNTKLKQALKDKKNFLAYYSELLDSKVLLSISKEDFKMSTKEEIIQEYFMNKLDFMNPYKFAIANIINFYNNNPKFILIMLKSTKKSMSLFLSDFKTSGNKFKIKLFEKFLLILWLSVFNKWLYEDNSNSSSFATIDKGIKRIKSMTSLFDVIDK